MSGIGPVQLIVDYDNVFETKRGNVLVIIFLEVVGGVGEKFGLK